MAASSIGRRPPPPSGSVKYVSTSVFNRAPYGDSDSDGVLSTCRTVSAVSRGAVMSADHAVSAGPACPSPAGPSRAATEAAYPCSNRSSCRCFHSHQRGLSRRAPPSPARSVLDPPSAAVGGGPSSEAAACGASDTVGAEPCCAGKGVAGGASGCVEGVSGCVTARASAVGAPECASPPARSSPASTVARSSPPLAGSATIRVDASNPDASNADASNGNADTSASGESCVPVTGSGRLKRSPRPRSAIVSATTCGRPRRRPSHSVRISPSSAAVVRLLVTCSQLMPVYRPLRCAHSAQPNRSSRLSRPICRTLSPSCPTPNASASVGRVWMPSMSGPPSEPAMKPSAVSIANRPAQPSVNGS